MGKVWDKSGQVEIDQNGEIAIGATVSFYLGGTTTPLTTYEDADETTPHETDNLLTNGSGRWPLIFIPFVTSYDVKVVTAGGVQLYYHVEIPNPDPVQASEDSVDETGLLQTGDVIWVPVDESRVGFVRLNGRTIGSAASGASERANADTADLFTFLWNKLANTQAAVSAGRGASAAADFAANKTIALLDGQSSVLMGLDDMGNTAAGLLAGVPFTNGDAITPGSIAGANTHTLLETELRAHTHTFSATTDSAGAHSHTFSGTTAATTPTWSGTVAAGGAHSHTYDDHGSTTSSVQGGSGANIADAGTVSRTTSTEPAHTHTVSGTVSSHTHTFSGTTSTQTAHTHTVSGTTDSTGSSAAHNNVPRALLGTYYMKL